MSLYYLIPDRIGKYDLEQKPSSHNHGGGLAVKAQRAIQAWSAFYTVNVIAQIYDALSPEFLVVDPFWFQSQPDIEVAITNYEKARALYKILYTSELTLLEIPAKLRHRIVNASHVVTTPCDWFSDWCTMQSINSIRLCDPVPESMFYRPATTKIMSVVAMGRISTDKNSAKVIDIFRALKDEPIRTIYIGGANLWGHSNLIDEKLESDMRVVADEFHYNLSQSEIASQLPKISCAIFDTFHETVSESNLECCMGGVMGFYGGHGLWDERPGIRGLESVSDFVDALRYATDNFSRPPVERKRIEQWALRNCSYTQFLEEWKGVLAYARSTG